VSTVNAFANVYDAIRDASVGGLALTITNFSARDVILLTDSTEAAGGSKFNSLGTDQFGGTLITLADRTTIDLIGINPNTVHTVAGLHGVLGIELTNKSIIPTS